MLKVTLKGLLARKLRLFTTSFAVLLGVAFMAGTLVLTDTIDRTFDELFATVNEGTDTLVRAEGQFDDGFGGEVRGRVDAALVEVVQGVDGVSAASGEIEGYARLTGSDGEPLGNPNAAPLFGRNWVDDEGYPFELAEGRAPLADDEVVIDRGLADIGSLAIGDRTDVETQAGTTEVTVVGIATFGGQDSPGGSSNVMFSTVAAQELVAADPGRFDAINARAEDGVSEGELRDRIAAALPGDVEVLTGSEATKEDQDSIGQFVGFIRTFLLAFAAIALFVGVFIIYNTFSIIVAHRTREMALLRAVGASRRQVLGSVVLEAVLIGLIASAVGLVLGVGIAAGLKGLFDALGFDIPAGGLVVTGTTVVTAFVVGVLVSVVSALFPALRASRVPPLAAMRDVAVDRTGRNPIRLGVGLLITALGAFLFLTGLFGDVDDPLFAVGGGALVLIIGIAVLLPIFSGPLSRAIGAPLARIKGMSGVLARENAMRNPSRTANTASALMIGVALVAFISIVAASAKASIDAIVDRTVLGDFVVNSASPGAGFGGLSPKLAAELNELPEVGAATGLRGVLAEVDGNGTLLAALDPATAAQVVDVEVVDGSYGDLGADSIAVFSDTAEEDGIGIGDTVPVRFVEGGVSDLRVALVYDSDDALNGAPYFISHAAVEARSADQFDVSVFVTLADGVGVEDARAAIEGVAEGYPSAEVQDQTEFKEASASGIDTFVALVYVLLAFSVIIALIGIANTLALSVFERTRELGLLRAVGMTRPQLRSMVRWESVIIALLGTLLGLGLGSLFGWALITAVEDEGFNTLVLPIPTLVIITVVAALAGVIAALRPASRAAKLDVLVAISTV